MTTSAALRRALIEYRMGGGRDYLLALKIGLHPATVSNLIRGARPVEFGDPRVLRLADALGVNPLDAFETVDEPKPAA